MNHWPEADRDGIDEQVNELDHGGNAGWEGRGDLILFEPDENEEFVVPHGMMARRSPRMGSLPRSLIDGSRSSPIPPI